MRNYLRFLLVLALLFSVEFAYSSSKRILSLAPSTTRNLLLLGGEDLLVGCTSFCDIPKNSKAKIVASAIDVNFEKALIQKPDLVLTTSLTSPKVIEKFRKMGVKVVNFPYPKSFQDICKNLQILATLIGKEAVAKRIINESKLELKKTISTVPKRTSKPKVFFQIGADPLFTVVPNTFMNDFITYAGATNIAADLKMGSITRETVLARNPDIIIVMLMGSVSKDETQKWNNFSNLNAVRLKKVFTMDDDKTCSPTPPLFVEALKEIIGYIY